MSIPVPESRRIPHTLSEGNVIFIKGSCPLDANWFSINLGEGPGFEPRTHLHFNPRFDQNSVVRSHFDGGWGPNEEEGGMPFRQGKKFSLRIRVGEDGFEIFVKERKFCDFKYRLPKENIQYLYITEGVNIDRINFPKEMGSDSECPGVPATLRVPGGIYPGMTIVLKGVPLPGADRFHVNLVCGPNFEYDDVAFHMDSRFNFYSDSNVVVRTAKVGGAWEQSEKDQDIFPFNAGANFKIKIHVEDSEYCIYINKQKFTEFKHRITDLDRVDYLHVEGAVNIHSISFC